MRDLKAKQTFGPELSVRPFRCAIFVGGDDLIGVFAQDLEEIGGPFGEELAFVGATTDAQIQAWVNQRKRTILDEHSPDSRG